MSRSEVDRYLAGVEEPKRTTLQQLRRTILDLLPDADEGMSYGLPAYRVEGKTVAGFGAFSRHLTFVPHSGSVLDRLGDELEGYDRTKSALHFRVDTPLSRDLVRRLLDVRLAEIRG